MKALHRIKYLFIIIILLSYTKANSQDFNFIPSTFDNYYFNPQNLGTTSPHVGDLIKFGNLNINLYNGLLDTKIDLEDYKDNDFDMFISLNYISNGFIPSKRPSLVGLNWLLKFGGVISREVKGSPDDTRGNYVSDPLKYIKDGIYVAKKDGNFKSYSETDLNNFNIDMNGCCDKTPNAIGDFKYDMEPDIFKFTFGNYSGSFLIDNSGSPKLLEENGCKISVDSLTIQSYSTTDAPASSAITITTPDGFIYTFGGNMNYLEYFIPDNPKYCAVRSRYITSWFLRTIEAPNHRKVLFTYNSVLQKNKYYNFVYSLGASTTYSTCTSYNSATGQTSSPSVPASVNNNSSIKKIIFEDKIHTPIIDNIKIENTTMKFNIQKTSQSFFDLADATDKSNFLSNITISNGNDIVKTIDFNYTTNNNYFFLGSVNNNGLKYQFDYNFNYSSPNPLTISIDHWGFWSGGYDIDPSNITDYCSNIETNRSVNTNVCDNFLLKKITYPTGGTTEIKYEYNRYTNYFDRNTALIQLDKYKLDNSLPCGGARVKTILDYDFVSKKYVTRNYLYQDTLANGHETGVIGIKPKYVTRENRESTSISSSSQYISGGWIINTYSNRTFSQTLDISTNTFGSINNFGEYHISYPNVIEINSDNSYTKYTFSSLLDVPDYSDQYYKITKPANSGNGLWVMYSDLTNPQLAEKHHLYFSNDLSSFRGKLIKKEMYSATNNLMMSENNIYNTDVAKNNYNISVSSSSLGYAAYKVLLTPCHLKNRMLIDNNGNTTNEDFTYNDRNFIKEQTITNSDKSKVSTYFNYPFDFTSTTSDDNSLAITEKLNKNIIISPIEVLKTIEKDGSKNIYAGIYNKYSITNSLALEKSISKLETTTPANFNTKDYMSNYKEIETFHNYDIYGNPIYVTTKDNLDIVYLWSYFGQHVIAEIKNSTYDEVSNILGTIETFSDFGGIASLVSESFISGISSVSMPDQAAFAKINALRASLPNAQIITYTYKPLIGMTSMTNPLGITTNYNYDEFGRLVNIKNTDSQVINTYNYHYKQ